MRHVGQGPELLLEAEDRRGIGAFMVLRATATPRFSSNAR